MTKCNKCQSTNVMHQVWGRTEYWVCKDCKQEIVDTPIEQEALEHFRQTNTREIREVLDSSWASHFYGQSPYDDGDAV